jgi:hypothetical protein
VEVLAARFGVEVADIVKQNRLTRPYRLRVGQLLRFPTAVR